MHGSSTEWKEDNSSPLKELFGKWFFALYLLAYAGFILINVVSPKLMATDMGSINVAIFYGFMLIILAMILAFAYNHFCTRAEEIMEDDNEISEEGV
jgi:uncharacterized membrane protein (DUF485 family)